jgi:hypothetical protein
MSLQTPVKPGPCPCPKVELLVPTNLSGFLATVNNDTILYSDPVGAYILNTYKDTMRCTDLWEKPMEKEMAQMWAHKVIATPVKANNHWVYANKYNMNGKIIARKAHLVAKGFIQIPGVDYFNTYASVVWYESLCIVLACAATIDYSVVGLHSLHQNQIQVGCIPSQSRVVQHPSWNPSWDDQILHVEEAL